MRNRGATSQNSVLFSTDPFRLRDIVRRVTIQLHELFHRTPWLPPFVLCVSYNCMSAALSNAKRGRRISQAARKLIKCRRISIDCTISRISSPAWEIRYSRNMFLFRSAVLMASGVFFNFSYSQIPSSHKVTLCRALG